MTTLIETHLLASGRDGLCKSLKAVLAASGKQVHSGVYKITVEKLQKADLDALRAEPREPKPLRLFEIVADNMPWNGVGFEVECDASEEEINQAAFDAAAEYVDYSWREVVAD